MSDPGLRRFDADMLALLEGEGSTLRDELVELAVAFAGGPEDAASVEAWLEDAQGRELVRIDSEDGLVAITGAGHLHLLELL